MAWLSRLLARRDRDSNTYRRSFLKRVGGLAAGFGAAGVAAAESGPVDVSGSAGPAGLDPFIGEIAMFAGNFAPRGWALCDGQMLPINGNEALFSILGTTYGGDGRTTFALPDLRGRVSIHVGTGPGLTERRLGRTGGQEQVALTELQMPTHSHTVSASGTDGHSDSPAGALPARTASGIPQYGTAADAAMAPDAIQPTGGGQPHDNMPPFLAVTYIIAVEGVFPSRS